MAMATIQFLSAEPETWWTVASVCAVVTAAAATWAATRVRGSTAVPAACWGVVASLVLAAEWGLRSAGWLTEPTSGASLRLTAAALSLCPAMSILGAKRPQHGVWQLIVGALAVILVLPGLSTALTRPGSVPDLHLLERCFLLFLALVGWINFIATGNGIAATLMTIGQLLLIRGFLPGVASDSAFAPPGPLLETQAARDALAAVTLAVGSVLACLVSARKKRLSSQENPLDFAARVNRPFLALRETFGAAWTLRIAERFDAIAASRGWPCRLGFLGLKCLGEPGEGAWQRDASRTLTALFRRFVTDRWLARHGWPMNISN